MDIWNPNEIKDKYITCLDCGQEFVWSASEQKFYLNKGLATPKRCPRCRQIRKTMIDGRDI
jgi:Zn finger protein HypA/HybF involved in hydrogenase expression